MISALHLFCESVSVCLLGVVVCISLLFSSSFFILFYFLSLFFLFFSFSCPFYGV